MSNASRGPDASSEDNILGPDYFGFCTSEIAALLSQDEDFLPFMSPTSNLPTNTMHGKIKHEDGAACSFRVKGGGSSSSLFSNAIGSSLSDFKRQMLMGILKQNVFSLSQAVDENIDPVIAIRWIESHLQDKKCQSSDSTPAFDADAGNLPCKKIKTSFSSSSDMPAHDNHLDYKSHEEGEPLLDSGMPREKEKDVNDDLRFLQEHDASLVEEIKKKHYDELYAILDHMELHLEKQLDTIMSTCRPMTHVEKHKLQSLISKFHPKDLQRVVEILENRKHAAHSCNNLHVDLEKVDNITLWRVHNYVEAFESARKHPV